MVIGRNRNLSISMKFPRNSRAKWTGFWTKQSSHIVPGDFAEDMVRQVRQYFCSPILRPIINSYQARCPQADTRAYDL